MGTRKKGQLILNTGLRILNFVRVQILVDGCGSWCTKILSPLLVRDLQFVEFLLKKAKSIRSRATDVFFTFYKKLLFFLLPVRDLRFFMVFMLSP